MENQTVVTVEVTENKRSKKRIIVIAAIAETFGKP